MNVAPDNDSLGASRRRVRDAYGIALGALVLSTGVLIAAGSQVSSPVALFAAGLQFVALVVTIRVSGASRRTVMAILLATVGVGALGTAVAIAYGNTGAVFALSAWLALVAITIVGIARRLRRYHQVTISLVLGLLCIYLLVGHLFGLAYNIASVVTPRAFSEAHQGISGSVYFSFVTLTTVGYGDLAPVHPFVRALAVLEAVMGQLYLVGVVSLAVGRLGRSRGNVPDSEESGEDAGEDAEV